MGAPKDARRPARKGGHELGHRTPVERHDDPAVETSSHPADDVLDEEAAPSVHVDDHDVDPAILPEQRDHHVEKTTIPVGGRRGRYDGVTLLQKMDRETLALSDDKSRIPADHRSEKTKSRARRESIGRGHLPVRSPQGPGVRGLPAHPGPEPLTPHAARAYRSVELRPSPPKKTGVALLGPYPRKGSRSG